MCHGVTCPLLHHYYYYFSVAQTDAAVAGLTAQLREREAQLSSLAWDDPGAQSKKDGTLESQATLDELLSLDTAKERILELQRE